MGVALLGSGLLRLRRPRRGADVDWIRRNPLPNAMLGGQRFGFDRFGAVISIALGAVAVLLGILVLALA